MFVECFQTRSEFCHYVSRAFPTGIVLVTEPQVQSGASIPWGNGANPPTLLRLQNLRSVEQQKELGVEPPNYPAILSLLYGRGPIAGRQIFSIRIV
jgi:hypothetical protein